MNRKIFSMRYVISILLICWIFLNTGVLNAQADPVLKAEPTHKELGTVKEGMKVHIQFKLTNVGNSEVNITGIETSAACIVGEIPKYKLQPRESMKMHFIFETLGYGGRTVTRTIKIEYNNKKLSPLELKVTGEVLASKPYQAAVGELIYNIYLIIDLRSEEVFKREHIIGAVNIPNKVLEERISKAPRNMILYLYSDDGELSDKAAKKLQNKGYSQCMSLIGGFKEWKLQYGDKYVINGSQ